MSRAESSSDRSSDAQRDGHLRRGGRLRQTAVRAAWRRFVFAWHFLTIIPLTRRHDETTESDLAGSMVWFPAVGLLIGGLLAAVSSLLSHVFAPIVVDALL